MKFVDIRAESSQIIVRPAMPAADRQKTALTRDGLTFPL